MNGLSDADLENTQSRYRSRFNNYGHDQKSVGWGEKGRQIERFRIMIDLLGLNARKKSFRVLDIGAGFGDFFRCLTEGNYPVEHYTGYEVVEELAICGGNIYGVDRRFNLINGDFLSANNDESFDYAVMSGCFNFKLIDGSNYDYIYSVLAKAMNCCTNKITANFITSYVDYEEDYIFYADPRKIIDIAYSLTRRFSLDHSYFPYEFGLTLHVDQSFETSYPVFEDVRFVQP